MLVRRSVISRFALALSVTAAGCGSSDDGQPSTPDAGLDAGPTPLCLEAEDHSDLEWLQENVFTRSCAAFSSCHQGRALSAGGLNLEAGNVEENVIGVQSELAQDMLIVAPGSPEDSYMMVILGQYGTDDPRIDPEVGTMPEDNPVLCQQKRDAVARWITELPSQ